MLFEYTAIDLHHRKIRGILEGVNEQEVKLLLKEKKLFIIAIEEKRTVFPFQIGQKQKGKLNFNQLVDFTRQMGIMINAGLSIVDALSIMSTQSTNFNEKLVITKLEDHIKSGNTLSGAMHDFPETFPSYYLSLIKAGESSGKLDDVFMRLADNLEKSKEFRGKVMGALIYPIVVVIAIVVVAFIMMTFVLPKLLDLYKNFNVELPITTKFIMAVSKFCQDFWPLIIVASIVSVVGLKSVLKNPKYRKKMDRYMLKIPVFGSIIKKSILVEATRTLGVLIRSGVPILEGIDIIKNTTDNEVYRDAFAMIHLSVEKGRTLGDALADTDLFPSIMIQMASVGERSGKMDETLFRLSNYFQMETEIAVKTATTLIEPAILVVLGLGVGFLVVSVLTPIYNLTSSFGAAQ
ncbi:MAG: type II secretion system F family protein [Patescibacteria group bacterium]|jgi:type IV pilus assembly protein PilC